MVGPLPGICWTCPQRMSRTVWLPLPAEEKLSGTWKPWRSEPADFLQHRVPVCRAHPGGEAAHRHVRPLLQQQPEHPPRVVHGVDHHQRLPLVRDLIGNLGQLRAGIDPLLGAAVANSRWRAPCGTGNGATGTPCSCGATSGARPRITSPRLSRGVTGSSWSGGSNNDRWAPPMVAQCTGSTLPNRPHHPHSLTHAQQSGPEISASLPDLLRQSRE